MKTTQTFNTRAVVHGRSLNYSNVSALFIYLILTGNLLVDFIKDEFSKSAILLVVGYTSVLYLV